MSKKLTISNKRRPRKMWNGGNIEGPSHSDGGIVVEMEGGEGVLMVDVMEDPTTKTRTGTNKEIATEMQLEHGGNPMMAKGGSVDEADYTSFKSYIDSLGVIYKKDGSYWIAKTKSGNIIMTADSKKDLIYNVKWNYKNYKAQPNNRPYANGGSVPAPLQSLVNDMIDKGVQRRTIKLKSPSQFKELSKRLAPAIKANLIILKQNPINKKEAYISLTSDSLQKIKYANGGSVDLFEDYENIPAHIQIILDKYEDEDNNYENLGDMLQETEAAGYTFEYGLDAEPYELRKMAAGGSIDLFGQRSQPSISKIGFISVYDDNGSQVIEFEDYARTISKKFKSIEAARSFAKANNYKAEVTEYAYSTFAEGGPVPSDNAVVNTWAEIPDQWKLVKPVKPVSYELKPGNKGFEKIVGQFIGQDELRPVMNGVNYSDKGIFATDAHRVIGFDKNVGKSNYGTFDFSGANVGLNDGGQEIKYPNIEGVIPIDSPYIYPLDFVKLRTYCEAILKGRYPNMVTNQISFKMADSMAIGFNARFIIGICTAMLELGIKNGYVGLSAPNKAAVFSASKQVVKTGLRSWSGKSEEVLMLVMPVALQYEDQYGAIDYDLAREANVYYDFSKNEIVNKNGSIAKFDPKLTTAGASALSKDDIKILKSVIKSSNTIPIIDNIALESGIASSSNLATSIAISGVNMPDGIYQIINNFPSKTDMPLNEFPLAARIEDELGVVDLDRSELEKALENAKNFVGKDDLRPTMTGLNFVSDGAIVAYQATDAHKLIRKEFKSAKATGTFDVILEDPRSLHTIISNSTSEKVQIRVGETNTAITAGNVRVVTRNIDGKYPNALAVIPRDTEERILLNAANIRALLKPISQKDRKNGNIVFKKGQLLFSQTDEDASEDEAKGIVTELGPLGYDIEEGRYSTDTNDVRLIMPVLMKEMSDYFGAFNAAYFLTAIGGLAGDFYLYKNALNKAYLISGEETKGRAKKVRPTPAPAPAPKKETMKKERPSKKAKPAAKKSKAKPAAKKKERPSKKAKPAAKKKERPSKKAKPSGPKEQTKLGLKLDKGLKAMHPGKRKAGPNAKKPYYYENRPDHSDKNRTTKLAKGGKVWRVTDISKATYLGPIEFQDNRGQYRYFEIMETKDRLIFGSSTNTGFIESGYIEKDGFSTDEALQELLADLEVYYNDGSRYTSMIVFNQRMAKGGSVDYEVRNIKGQAKQLKKQTHFAIHKPTNSIATTWDYKGYDHAELMQDKDDYFWLDLRDNHEGNVDKFRTSDFAIVRRANLPKYGIDLNDYRNFQGQQYAKGGNVKTKKSDSMKRPSKIKPAKRSTRSLAADKRIKAMHPGKRKAASGVTYYERRANRSDKNRTTKLAKGGCIKCGGRAYDNGGYVAGTEKPAIYVADIAAYNEGKLIGEWLDLTQYDDGEEVSQAIHDLTKKWSKEQGVFREEWSIHDYENFSSSMYSEYMGEEDFDHIIKAYKISESSDIPIEVLTQIVNDFSPDDLESWIDEHYRGEHDSDTDFAWDYVEQTGGVGELGKETLERYFDMESFGRDLAYDYYEFSGHYFDNN